MSNSRIFWFSSGRQLASGLNWILCLGALLLTIAFPFCTSLLAQTPTPSSLELTAAEAAWLQAHPVLKVSNEMDWPPFDFVIDGQPAGYSIDLMDRVAARLGIEFEYINGLTWDELLEAFKNKEIDLIHCIYYLESRTKFALFSEPYFINNLAVFSRAEADFKTLNDLSGKIAALPKGYSLTKILRDTIPEYRALETNNMVEAIQSVASGRADYTIESFAATQYVIRENAIPGIKVAFFPRFPEHDPNEFALRVAAHVDNPILLQVVQKALDSISEEEIAALKNKWFGAQSQTARSQPAQRLLSDVDRAYLRRKGTIKMCVAPGWPPIDWIDGQGQHRGIVADLMQIIRDRLDHKIELVPTPTWQDTLTAIQQRDCDFVPAITQSADRETYLKFTSPYQELDVVIATDRKQIYVQDLAALTSDEKVGAVAGSIYQTLLEENYPTLDIVLVPDIAAGFKAVRRGQVIGFVDNLTSLAYFIQQTRAVDMQISGQVAEPIQLRMGVRNDDEQLHEILTKALASISAQQYQDLSSQWIDVTYKTGIDYGLLWRWLGGAIVILLGVFYWNRQLAAANAQIRQLNERLSVENLRMGAELDVAQRVQQMILPKPQELAAIEPLDIAGYMRPAAEVGGDYYDVLFEAGVVTIGIGDVTGHGLESGLVMMMLQTVVRTLTQLRETDPVRFLNTVNATLYANVQRMDVDRSLTLAILTYVEGHLCIIGQHEEVLLVRADGQLTRIHTLDLGLPIGLVDDIAAFVDQKTLKLGSGDGIVLYTDGIPEAWNAAQEFYGLERLCQVIACHWQADAAAIQQAVIDDVQAFIGHQTVMDDITLLVLKQR
ncbi:MAG: transporter substrate-binding domain-containing protein [Cyanobacteria bacterium P01_G01_bin.54]